MTNKNRVIVSLSDEAFEKLNLLCFPFGDSDAVYTKSQVIEYCILFGPLKIHSDYLVNK